MITDSLNKLIEIKSDIKDAIINQGVEVGDKFEEYAEAISQIEGAETKFVVPAGMKFGESTFTEFPSNMDWSEVENYPDWSKLFYNCKKLTKAPKLNTSNVTNMSNLFYGNSALTEFPDFNWDTSKVTTMEYLFYGCSKMNVNGHIDLSGFDITNVTNIANMLPNVNAKTIDFSGWDTSNVKNMASFISSLYIRSLPAFNTQNVIDGNASYNSPIKSASLRNFGGLIGWKNNLYLSDCKCLSYESLCNILNGLASGVSSKTLYLSQDCVNMLEDDDIAAAIAKGWSISPAKNITGPVVVTSSTQVVNSFQINKKIYDYSQFKSSFNFSSDLRYFEADLSSTTSLYSAFSGKYNMVEIVLTGTDNITSMERAFSSCTPEKLSISSTSNVTNMRFMFNLSQIDKVDLTGLDLSKVENMEQMFGGCSKLIEVRMDSELNPDLIAANMFVNITTNGTFYYNPNYDYSKIIAELPSTWTAVPLT